MSDVLAPDLVLHNGKIVTVDQDFSIAQAVAIKNGRFVAVGSDSEILALAGAQTERVDLEGKTILPGLNDSHVHLAHRVGEPPDPLIPKFAQAKSIAEIVEVVAQKVAVTPPGEVVWIPRGPRLQRIQENRWPTRYDLDPVSPENPVILAFAGDQVNVGNSLGSGRRQHRLAMYANPTKRAFSESSISIPEAESLQEWPPALARFTCCGKEKRIECLARRQIAGKHPQRSEEGHSSQRNHQPFRSPDQHGESAHPTRLSKACPQ